MNHINISSSIPSSTRIGPFTTIEGKIEIGKNCKIATSVAIHGEGVIADDVIIDAGVSINGKFSFGPGVRLGPNTVIENNVEIGEQTNVGPLCCFGTPPQHKQYKNEQTFVKIGKRNIFREYTTVHRATTEHIVTEIGDDCYFMAYCHIAHDCVVGNGVTMANCATLGGHTHIGDYANIGLLVPIHQFSRIGKNTMIGMGYRVSRDVPPFVLVKGEPLYITGPNRIGLKRSGFDDRRIETIEKVYDRIKQQMMSKVGVLEQVLGDIEKEYIGNDDVQQIIEFYRNSKRGVVWFNKAGGL